MHGLKAFKQTMCQPARCPDANIGTNTLLTSVTGKQKPEPKEVFELGFKDSMIVKKMATISQTHTPPLAFPFECETKYLHEIDDLSTYPFPQQKAAATWHVLCFIVPE
jgi:hypothetical protein